MSRSLVMSLVGIFLLGSFSAVAQIQEAIHSVALTDPAGDVKPSNNNPGKDVVEVEITTDGQHFGISVTLAEPVKSYLEGGHAGRVVELLLDVDTDEATGGKPFFYETPGFEYQIVVGTCIEYGTESTVCSGGLGDAAETGYFSTYDLERFTEGSETELISDVFNWRDRGVDIVGNTVEVSLPYAAMTLEPGQRVRLAVKENDDATFKKEYMPEVLLTVK